MKIVYGNIKAGKIVKDLKFFAENILSKLQNFESQKWQEILNSAGGKSEGHGNNNHFITADKLPRDEKLIFIKLGYRKAA